MYPLTVVPLGVGAVLIEIDTTSEMDWTELSNEVTAAL